MLRFVEGYIGQAEATGIDEHLKLELGDPRCDRQTQGPSSAGVVPEKPHVCGCPRAAGMAAQTATDPSASDGPLVRGCSRRLVTTALPPAPPQRRGLVVGAEPERQLGVGVAEPVGGGEGQAQGL